MQGYLSAIQAIHEGCPDGSRIADNPVLKFLIEGMAITRPRIRNIWPSWDLVTVLAYLKKAPFEPLEAATLRDAALKTAFLIAIASGRRCSEIHALTIGSHIVWSNSGVTMYFRPDFLAKNERSDFVAAPLFLPYITKSKDRAKRLNCPVRALKWYLDKTKNVRSDDVNQLFISSKRPYRAVAKSTIAGWLVEVISRSGGLEYSGAPANAHSVRALSSSWAFAKGLSIKEIINTVSWRTETTFVKVYMRDTKPLLERGSYAKKVLSAS